MLSLEQHILGIKQRALSRLVPTVPADQVERRPADSQPFIDTGIVAYPLPGAGASVIVTRIVPAGMRGVIKLGAVVHIGGGFVDGSGNVIWRVLINGAAVKGLSALSSQVGTWSQPIPLEFTVEENDVVTVTAEVPAAQAPMPGGTTTGARLHGWLYAVTNRTQSE